MIIDPELKRLMTKLRARLATFLEDDENTGVINVNVDRASEVRIFAQLNAYLGDTEYEIEDIDRVCVVIGSPATGLSVHGPFIDHAEAEAYVDKGESTDWWILDMVDPLEPDAERS